MNSYIYIFGVLICVVCLNGQQIPSASSAFPEQIMKIAGECAQANNINLATMNPTSMMNPENYRNVACFFYCLFKQYGLATVMETGMKFAADKMLEFYNRVVPGNQDGQEKIQNCISQAQSSEDNCSTAFAMMMCMMKDLPQQALNPANWMSAFTG